MLTLFSVIILVVVKAANVIRISDQGSDCTEGLYDVAELGTGSIISCFNLPDNCRYGSSGSPGECDECFPGYYPSIDKTACIRSSDLPADCAIPAYVDTDDDTIADSFDETTCATCSLAAGGGSAPCTNCGGDQCF